MANYPPSYLYAMQRRNRGYSGVGYLTVDQYIRSVPKFQGGEAPTTQYDPNNPYTGPVVYQEKSSNTMLYVIVGGLALAALVFAVK